MSRLRLIVFALLVFLLAAASRSGAALVAIDAGHGGSDEGIVYTTAGARPVKEKDIALSLAKAAQAALRQRGIPAFLVREVDRNMGISERASAANEKSPSLFLSIHVSSRGDFNIYVTWMPAQEPDVRKLYLYSRRQRPYIAQSREFAASLEQAVKEAFPGKGVSYIEMPLSLLNEISAPAVMIEVPYPDSVDYGNQLNRQRFAAAIANAVTLYQNIKPAGANAR
ncbi:MAG: N-acetylmuramoyl-L-alanine amidase [Nitrospiraceae bacterium]|nr:N-acetylmuramoyl-L-alanine amidase [Nitrospiraceae bacterium]